MKHLGTHLLLGSLTLGIGSVATAAQQMAPLEQEEQPAQRTQRSQQPAASSSNRPKQQTEQASREQSGEGAQMSEQDAVFGKLEQLIGQLQQALSQPSGNQQAQAGAGNAGGQASKAAQQGQQAEGKNGAQSAAANSGQNVVNLMAQINEVAALAEGKGWTLRPQQRAVLNAVKQSNDTTKIEVLNLAMRLGAAMQLVGQEAAAKQESQNQGAGKAAAGKGAAQGGAEKGGQGAQAQIEPTPEMRQLMEVTQVAQALLFKQPTEAELGKVYEAVEVLAKNQYGSPELNGKVNELLGGAKAKIGESIAQNPEVAQASSMIALVGVGMQREQMFAGELVTAMTKYKELGTKMQAAKTEAERANLMKEAKALEADVKQLASANMDIIGGSAREGESVAVNRNPDNPMEWIGQTLGEIGSSTGVLDELQRQQEHANRMAEQEHGKPGSEQASHQSGEHDPNSAKRFQTKNTKPKSEFARQDVHTGRAVGKSMQARKAAGMNPSVNHPGAHAKTR